MAAGRPSKYKKEFAAQAAKLCALGATDTELADFFEIEPRTLYRWKHDHKEFCQALKVAKDAADIRVERSLYQRAIGYSFPSQKIFHFQGQITRADCVEHVAPDVTACIFWLKNRKGEQWRDKVEGAGAQDIAEAIFNAIEAQAA
jgi:hypothetical protein